MMNADEDPRVVIIGSGAAGLSAALPLAAAGVRTTIITPDRLGDGSSAWAQGGLAAVLAADDTRAQHVEDTLIAGAGLCERGVVEELVAEAPVAIERLVELGAAFDRDADGSLALGLEGGHRARRIVHAGGDASGAEVCRVLAVAARAAAARGRLLVGEGWHADRILTDDDGSVCGVAVHDDHGNTHAVGATAVVLATGGTGRLWDDTTNPATSAGDGLAMALRAGAVTRDLEFLQFHPTMLVVPPSHRRPGDRGVLISEAVRGEGARLIDGDGTPVMAGVDLRGDLAPRDVVAAAMHRHLADHGQQHLYLDGRHLGEDGWRHHFPSILAMCRERGVDPARQPIPVRPAAHYHCGGVVADLAGRTTVPGLYAIGEVASTGVQGANRLASNSLTEALVAGHRLGTRLAAEPPAPTARVTPLPDPGTSPDDPALGLVPPLLSRYAGVLRDRAGLQRGLAALDAAVEGRPVAGQPNAVLVARAVLTAALARQESRGCHRRSDHDRSGAPRHQLITLRGGRLTGRWSPVSDADPVDEEGRAA